MATQKSKSANPVIPGCRQWTSKAFLWRRSDLCDGKFPLYVELLTQLTDFCDICDGPDPLCTVVASICHCWKTAFHVSIKSSPNVFGMENQHRFFIHDHFVILWLRVVVGLLTSHIIQLLSYAGCWLDRNQLLGPWLWGSFKKEKRQGKPLATRSNPSQPTFCSWKKQHL